MKTSMYLSAALLLVGVVFVSLRKQPAPSVSRNSSETGSPRPDLEYFKAVNSIAPPKDPQLLFLLMGQYSNANLQGDGAEFFSARLREFGPHLTDVQKALYLSAIGLLRAQHAPSVSLLHRVGYVKETIAILEQARQLSGGHVFVVNWIAGIVYSQLPGFFHQRTGGAGRADVVCRTIGTRRPMPAGCVRFTIVLESSLSLGENKPTRKTI